MVETNKTADIDWDYKGWEGTAAMSGLQSDWTQTLITRINQCSAQVGKDSFMGGANTISCHPKLFNLLKELAYVGVNDEGELSLSNRYKIKFDNTLEEDIINVTHVMDSILPHTREAYDSTEKDTIRINSKSPLVEDYKIKENAGEINLIVMTTEMLTKTIKIENFKTED